MASLRAIRTRIKSVRNTQKITKAMKLVAAAKLRRAQDAVVRTRPYAQALDELLASLSASRAAAEIPPHPLMEVRENPQRIEVVLLTSDRGLCGGFNSNIIRRAQRFLVEEADKYDVIQFSTIGRRGRDFAKKRGIQTRKDYVGFFGRLRYAMAKEVAATWSDGDVNYDSVVTISDFIDLASHFGESLGAPRQPALSAVADSVRLLRSRRHTHHRRRISVTMPTAPISNACGSGMNTMARGFEGPPTPLVMK